jgi:chromosome segregation ATPase
MSFGLDALFEERLEAFPIEISSALRPSAGSPDVTILSLIKQRDTLQALVEEHEATIKRMQHPTYSRVPADAIVSIDMARELHRLADENERLRKDKVKLEENLRAAESETATLRDKLDDKSQKVKTANKKTKSAKEVAVKEEDKTKTALNEKQQRAKSEQKMKKEKNDAKAAFQEQRKIAEDLRAELFIEQAGNVHLRETQGTDSDQTTVVIPMEFLIRRTDYIRVQDVLESNRISYIDRAKEWYKAWRALKREDEKLQVVCANYVDVEEDDKLYADMIEDGFMTGAEHDAPLRA